MKIRKIIYPSNEFYEFGKSTNSVDISNEDIENWINEGIQNIIKQLKNKIESPYYVQASGNTIVIIFYFDEGEVNGERNDYFEVIVAKNYKEGSFWIKDINDTGKNIEDMTIKELIQRSKNGENIFNVNGYDINIKERLDI